MIKSIYKTLPFVSFYFFLSLRLFCEQWKDDTGLIGCWWELFYRLVINIFISAALISKYQMTAKVERGTRLH